MRELIYGVEGKAANLRTFATDDPGHGGACHCYVIVGPDGFIHENIEFQNGPVNVDRRGVNGIQNEDLLAILIDRLEGFQKGPYACEHNQNALDHCADALHSLQQRTRERIARNVEGTHTV